MAADNAHHLEGAYLPTGVFRMYFYDEFTKPQTLAAGAGAIKATLIVKDAKTGKDDDRISLVRSGTLSAGADRQAAAAGGDVREGEVQAGRQGQPLRLHVPGLLEGAARRRRPRRMTDAAPAPATAPPALGAAARRPPPSGSATCVRHRSGAGAAADSRHGAGDARAARDAHRSDSRVHRQGLVRRDLRAGVPGEGSRARARRAQERAAAGAAQDRRAGDRASWCARPICSTRSATSATSSRSPRRTPSSSRRRRTSSRRFPRHGHDRNHDARVHVGARRLPRSSLAGVALGDPARRGAQGDHLEVHLQRRRVPDPARSLRAAATSPAASRRCR